MPPDNPPNTDSLETRIERLEREVGRLLRRERRERVSSRYVSWAQAAVTLGIEARNPGEAARRRILRERSKGNGFPLRVVRRGVLRQDFEGYLEHLEQAHPSVAETVRKVMKEC